LCLLCLSLCHHSGIFMKILTILGARPQFIKAAAFSAALSEFNREVATARSTVSHQDESPNDEESEEGGGSLLSEDLTHRVGSPGEKAPLTSGGAIPMEERILHTGQHYDFELSEQIFLQLGIPRPYLNLDIGSGGHGRMTGEMLVRIEQEILSEKPGMVVVYGDTNSTLAGALAAAKMHVPVCHVEAGLRSFDKRMPEEINRVLTDHVSALLFAPTRMAVSNLQKENITGGVYHVGDIMYDAAIRFGKIARQESNVLRRLSLTSFFLATVHRQENTDDRDSLAGIISAFDEIATGDCPVIFPNHPRTVKMLDRYKIKPQNPDVRVIPPLPFLDMIVLEQNARAILTDSGGIQKEAYFHRTPCITLRDVTEWTETVEAGWNQLAGSDTGRIVQAAGRIKKGEMIDEYGRGKSGREMIKILTTYEK
jgi:UDP-GlcNAc3NAcA epimerase